MQKIFYVLCTNKRKAKDNENVTVSGNVPAFLKKEHTENSSDSSMFSLPCTIRDRMISIACYVRLKGFCKCHVLQCFSRH